MVCVFVVLSFCGVSSLLCEGFFWCVFLGLRLYLFLLVGGVWWSILFIPSSMFVVLMVCSAWVAVVGVLGVGGYVLRAMYWLCCVFCRFV